MARESSKASAVAAVTGGNGFIGRALVSRLLDAGYHVRVLSSRPSAAQKEDSSTDTSSAPRAGTTRIYQANLAAISAKEPDALLPFLDGASVVYHLAGTVSRAPDARQRMMQLHIEGTRALLAAVALASPNKRPERFVLMSTSGTVGVADKPTLATDESGYAVDPALRWAYYESKIYQEKLAISWAREHDTPMAILRPSLALGPGDHDMSSTGDVLNFLERKIPGIPGGGLSFVDARDIADAAVAAGQIDAATLRTGDHCYRTYLLGAANLSFRDYLNMLEKQSGVSAPAMEAPPKLSVLGAKAWEKLTGEAGRRFMNLDPASADMANYYWYIDSSRAADELGFAPRAPEQTLRETIDWLRNRFRAN